MINLNKVYLHNVAEINDGVIYRYPQKVIKTLGYLDRTKGQEKAVVPAHCELRFHTLAKEIEIELEALDSDGFVTCTFGDFEIGRFQLTANEITKITLSKHDRFIELNPTAQHCQRRFSPDLVRVIFENGPKVRLVNINTSDEDYELPNDNQMPKRKVLVYGSSISQGAGSHSLLNSYAQTFANYANVDILNKGLSGACFCEKETVDYLSSIDCDLFLYELGCNMRGCMTIDEFKERVEYLISKTREQNPTKPIVILSILDFFREKFTIFDNPPYHEFNQKAPEILKEISNKYNNVAIIHANELMTDITCISYDMLHPSEWGHRNMGINLANKIKNLL